MKTFQKQMEQAMWWNDISRSIDAWDRIAKYTEPTLKAVECYPEADRVVNVIVKRFDSNAEKVITLGLYMLD